MRINIKKKSGLRFGKRSENPTFIVIHHAMCQTPSCTFGTLKGKGISTHYEVDKDGTVIEYGKKKFCRRW